MKVTVALLCAVIAVVAADADYAAPAYPAAPAYSAPPQYKPAYKKEKYEEDYPPAPPRPFAFGYAVKDDYTYNTYNREENSDGQNVSGSYTVHLPDGRIQTVTYKAGPYGNVAEVTYQGEPVYPEYIPPKKSDYPTYSAPSYSKPSYSAPSYPAKKYEEPKYEEPKYEAPRYDAPQYSAPAKY